MENQNKYVMKVRESYVPQEHTKLDELKELDKKVKMPALIFACIFGAVSALIFGTGMCLAMQVIVAESHYSAAVLFPAGFQHRFVNKIVGDTKDNARDPDNYARRRQSRRRHQGRADGFAFASKVRENDKQIPILFMTALDDKPSKQLGYKIGIDDYVVKPFDCDLLMLRVVALLRRANIERSRELVAGNLRMNKDEHTAYVSCKRSVPYRA